MDSTQSLNQQYRQADLQSTSLTTSNAADQFDNTAIEVTETDSLATTVAAVVSGGVTGAAIGQIVAGKMGRTIGAVIGGVAGAAIGNEGNKLADHLGESVVEVGENVVAAVKEAPERLKTLAADRFGNDDDAWAHDQAQTNAVDVTAESEPEAVEPETATSKRLASNRETLSQSIYKNSTTAQSSTIRAILPAKTHFYLGVALGRQGKLAESIDEFQQALRLASKSAETHYNLGIALVRQGNQKQALEHLRQASTLCLKQGKARGAKFVNHVIRSLSPEQTHLQY